VVAVVIGYFFGGEPLGARTVLGTLFVLVSVMVITTARPKEREQPPSQSAASQELTVEK